MARKRITQFVELIETLGPDTKSDAPARFISIAVFIFTAFFAQWTGGGKKTAPYWMQQAWYVSVRNDAIAFDAQRWIRHQDRGPYNLDIYGDGQDRRKFLLLSLLRQQLPDTSLRHGPKYDGRPTGHMQ